VTIYTELLRIALADALVDGRPEAPIDGLLDRLRACRTEEGAAEWTAYVLAHDVALVQLCERLGVEHALTDPRTAPGERYRLLAVLGDRGLDLGGPAGEAGSDGATQSAG
jgi:hypothetical protein